MSNHNNGKLVVSRHAMRVMPANSTGWIFHALARETGCLGHLLSPGAQRGPWPWFPYALDNGAFSCWDADGGFNHNKWDELEPKWKRLLFWAQSTPIKPLWAIVPDVPGNGDATLGRWGKYVGEVIGSGIPTALAVQDGMTVDDVRSLEHQPDVICVGGTTDWKWGTVEKWASSFPRVHLLRCNAPDKLEYLNSIGVESCDGTGWNRGNRTQTRGLEEYCRRHSAARIDPLWPHACRSARDAKQEAFA